jgi:Ternary complex associated domain 9
MAKILKPVLIGDPNPDRFSWLKNVLDEEYGLDIVQAKTFDELQRLVEESNKSREQAEKSNKSQENTAENDWSLLFIANDLPPFHTKKTTPERVKTYFTTMDDLNKWGDFITVLIVTQEMLLDWRGIIPPTRIIHLSDPPKPEERQSILRELGGLGGLRRVPNAESKIVWDKHDRIFREQIRSLSDNRNLQDGERHLARLISRCIDCSKVEKVEIKQLGQGKSGASVFRLCVETNPVEKIEVKTQEFVLKLCQAGGVWKLKSEVRGHIRANQGLGHPGYREHLPKLNKAYIPCGDLGHLEEIQQANQHIVRSGHWYAVHYDFLGGESFGQFVDLETALVASAKELEKKLAITEFAVEAIKANKVRAARAHILETILQWLCENWYSNSRTGYVQRKEMKLWDSGDAPEQEYIVMPPYKLTGRSKGWIQNFINSQEAEMGGRFFTDWENHRYKVFRLVSEDQPAATQLGKLGEPLPVVLSQVHGDLNVNNILLWIRHKHPFLIDFPFYQEAGHALQDFAQLEVEIKFALLDRQKDSSEQRLRAFEHTYTQMPIWQEMENRLLDQWDQKVPRWLSKGYAENVQLCYELVQLVRRKAQEVQQNNQCAGPPAGDFLAEYWPALLYHTVRAIGYPSLSVFKRLLAVYSASSILTRLNCFSDYPE